MLLIKRFTPQMLILIIITYHTIFSNNILGITSGTIRYFIFAPIIVAYFLIFIFLEKLQGDVSKVAIRNLKKDDKYTNRELNDYWRNNCSRNNPLLWGALIGMSILGVLAWIYNNPSSQNQHSIDHYIKSLNLSFYKQYYIDTNYDAKLDEATLRIEMKNILKERFHQAPLLFYTAHIIDNSLDSLILLPNVQPIRKDNNLIWKVKTPDNITNYCKYVILINTESMTKPTFYFSDIIQKNNSRRQHDSTSALIQSFFL